jgi:hypothetical protein
MNTLRTWLIRHLGIRDCGAYGGTVGDTTHWQRWCLKPFGHTDSCAYTPLPDLPTSQPGHQLRATFRGHR